MSVWAIQPPEAQAFDPENPPEGLFMDEWMEMRLGDEKVGWTHVTYTRQRDEIRTETTSYMKIARGLVAITVETNESTVESVKGEPYSFDTKMTIASQPVITRGTIQGKQVSVTTAGPGYSQTETYDFPKGALMTWGLARLSYLKGFEPGTDYDFLMYSPSISTDKGVSGTISIGKPEPFDYLGDILEGPKVTTMMYVGGAKIPTYGWMDSSGRLLITKVDMMGMPMVMVTVDRKTALEDFVPPEMFISNLIILNRSIPEDAESVTYALKLKSGSMADSLPPESSTQKVSWDEKSQTAYVTVLKAKNVESESRLDMPLSHDFVEYLKGNLMINSDSPKVQELAGKAHPSNAESPLEIAYKLCDFVNDYIEEKNLSVGFATAAEIVENPEGDCSEHAVLLAALGRVHGVPSRVAAGLLYLPEYAGKKNIMGYHMWTQFFIDGQWVDFDATTNRLTARPIRVALLYSSLKDDSLSELGLVLMDLMGQLEIEVADVVIEEDD